MCYSFGSQVINVTLSVVKKKTKEKIIVNGGGVDMRIVIKRGESVQLQPFHVGNQFIQLCFRRPILLLRFLNHQENIGTE
jgi:hypothetical protein